MAMVGPFTPTLLALLTKSGRLSLPTMRSKPPVKAAASATVGTEFHGKVAVITGAASGIGAALARKCKQEGCRAIVLADNSWATVPSSVDSMAESNPDDHPLVRELRGSGGTDMEVLGLHVDVSSKEDLQRMHDETLSNFGPPHLLFNNAGTGMPGILSATEEALTRSFDINFWSVIHAMRLFIPSMEQRASIESKDGDFRNLCHVVNTASLAGISEACGLYGVTKHSVVAATEAVSSELAWKKSNVRVSVLCPSYVASNVAATTVRSKLNTPPPTQQTTGSNSSLDSDDSVDIDEDLQELFAGLPALIANGMSPEDVADMTFEGMRQGRRYIYTDEGHTIAAIEDRVDQLRAGGLQSDNFQRRMESVVEDELAKAAGAVGGAYKSTSARSQGYVRDCSMNPWLRRPSNYICGTPHRVTVSGLSSSFSSSASACDGITKGYCRLEEGTDVAAELRAALPGDTERLSFSNATINNHASLESGFFGWKPPDAVAFANSTQEVSAVLKVCNKHRIPVVAYGTGTSVEGHIDCTRGGLLLDISGMDAILSVHEADMDATVQAGVTREKLNDDIRHSGLFFSVDPGANASIGGMVATNASGTTTLRYGNMASNVLGLTAVLANGDIVHAGGRSRQSSAGYDLTRLLIGSEGTLAVITEVTVKLHPHATAVSAAVCQFPTLSEAVEAAAATTYVATPARMELLDEVTMSCLDGYQGQSFQHEPCIFFEFHGSTEDAVRADIDTLRDVVEGYGGKGFEWATTTEDRTRLWKARHDAFWAVKAQWPGTDLLATDVCVPISRLAEIVDATAEDIQDLNVIAAPLFGHVGDGNFHLLIVYKSDEKDQLEAVRELEHRLVTRAIDMGGTCTGEHGIGTSKIQYLDRQLGTGAVEMMKTVKVALDPQGILNPDKVIDVPAFNVE